MERIERSWTHERATAIGVRRRCEPASWPEAVGSREREAHLPNHEGAGLAAAAHTGKSTRTHDGVIITLRSNLRWCSDGFEIRCWNGERVQVAFSLDCCDREVMSYVATSGGHHWGDGPRSDGRSVERRFGPAAKRCRIRSNGCRTTGRRTPRTKRDTLVRRSDCSSARHRPIRPRATAWPSPSSKPSSGTTSTSTSCTRGDRHERLAVWFEDYNEVHPHKGLRLQSPREYRRETANA